jgi:hypothetical protein
MLNDAKYIGLDVHQATISVVVLDCTGHLVMGLSECGNPTAKAKSHIPISRTGLRNVRVPAEPTIPRHFRCHRSFD